MLYPMCEHGRVTVTTDWYAWHAPYDELVSPLTRRLAVVQDAVREFLDTARPGPLRVVSLASGQSRDLLPLLIEHPRGVDVRGRLVELDPRNVDFTEGAVLGAGLSGIEVVAGDAGRTDAYAGAVPADLVLACGLLGSITAAEVEATVAALPQLCAVGATLVWTRNRRTEDPTPQIRGWLAAAGFAEVSVVAGSPDDGAFTVGVARWTGEAGAVVPGTRMFSLS
jgi:hypothetical protein